MKNNNFSLPIALFLIIFLIIGCSNNEPAVVESNNNNNPFYTPSNYTQNPIDQDFLTQYDNPNLVGIIAVENIKYNIINGGNTVDDYSQTAYAFIVNDSRTKGRYVGNIVVNASALEQYHLGSYLLVGDDPFVANFGSGVNKFLIDSGNGFPEVMGSASFVSPIHITNISLNQNISKSQDLVINWAGGKQNELVQVKIIKIDPDTLGLPMGTYKKTTSGNSLTIPSAQLQAHLSVNGLYSLLITTYEPHYFTLSNGKEICFMGVSKHEITINITD